MAADDKNKITLAHLNRYKKEGRPVVAVSAYDFPQAQLCGKAAIDIILVGDSLGMTTLGYSNTLPVTMDDMIAHSSAVKRANTNCFLIGDMPYGSFINEYDAIKNANRFLVSGMDAVKTEGPAYDQIDAIVKSGIICMGHLGLTPQTRARMSGYKVQGKTKKDVYHILEQAKKLEDCGVSFILFEAMPAESAEYIKDNLRIPCYGIGAGDKLDGQLIIYHDLVGLFFEFKSKFVKRYCEAGLLIENALKEYAKDVREKRFPFPENFYEIKEEELEKLLGNSKWKYEENK